MAAVILSHAQALRVIGQNLIPLGIDSFELAKWGDDYIVWEHGGAARDLSAKQTFFKKITRKIVGHADSEREILNRIYFSHVEIFNSDMEHQSKRSISDSPSDLRDLSFVLRVLGGYLDRKAAREFTISWSTNSIKLRYDQKEENFTLQNLYDFGISMYLKRTDRRRTN